MCPFCISALAVVAAKALSVGGCGTLAAKLALKKRENASESQNAASSQRAMPTGDSHEVAGALIAAPNAAAEPRDLART